MRFLWGYLCLEPVFSIFSSVGLILTGELHDHSLDS